MIGENRGARGERLAAKWYKKQGCRIVEANYRTRMGEVDLIVLDGETYVFVEVKARGSGSIAQPREFVDARKQQRLILAAQQYIAGRVGHEVFMRFDVVEVLFSASGKPEVRCIQNAFGV